MLILGGAETYQNDEFLMPAGIDLDEPIVRRVSTRPGLEPMMAVLEACRPDRFAG